MQSGHHSCTHLRMYAAHQVRGPFVNASVSSLRPMSCFLKNSSGYLMSTERVTCPIEFTLPGFKTSRTCTVPIKASSVNKSKGLRVNLNSTTSTYFRACSFLSLPFDPRFAIVGPWTCSKILCRHVLTSSHHREGVLVAYHTSV
jgi:hypothetical protein